MNLRNKLFLAFIGLVIMPLIILGVITFSVTFKSIEEKHSQEAQYSLKAISYSIKNVFKEIDNVTDNGIATGVFQEALKAKDPNSQNLSGSTQLVLNATQKHFRSLLYNHPAIEYAFLYNLQDVERSRIISIFNKEDFIAMPYERFKEHELYGEVMARNGLPKWIAPYEYPELTGKNRVFTQIRLIKELTKLDKVGVLVVQIKDWEFESIFHSLELGSSSRDTRFLLVNDDGLIVYDYKSELDGERLQKFMSNNLRPADASTSFKGKFNGEESIISIHRIEDYSWSLVSVTSWSYLSKELLTFGKWFVLIIGLCLITAMMFSLLFMNRITGTIGIIVRFMRKVEDGDFSVRVEEKGDDELLLLQQGFNNQMNKINELFEEVKHEQRNKSSAELRVLQAQIKPHFLFNTLESINVLAVQNEGKKVSKMVLLLARILRISIQGSEEIRLKLEVEHLRSYLEIQKFRFEDLFEYEIDIPEEMMNGILLKLTLQPLVENSIQHGFEGISYIGKIKVSGRMSNDHMVLTVEDNGIGLTTEQLLRIQQTEADYSEHIIEQQNDNQEQRGLGLRSVVHRLRYQYGSNGALFICSEPGKGTIVQCMIPYKD
ncbi:cache domain-containing sensor histidine kinase [Paenibacillus sp. GXUN7292]|uniref:cache domain-containing sensor histidine kinase n=1 Tax=Paenibacillus sp. GXUN7292 TaxID=3422499 RepID=UPI003D7D3ED1